MKGAISPTSGVMLGAVDFANLAEVALEHGPSLRAVALECHAAACERALSAAEQTSGSPPRAFDPAVLGSIVCNYAVRCPPPFGDRNTFVSFAYLHAAFKV